jgi:hypothetical protein
LLLHRCRALRHGSRCLGLCNGLHLPW